MPASLLLAVDTQFAQLVAVWFPMQAVRGNVLEVIMEKDQRGQREVLMKDLDLEQV